MRIGSRVTYIKDTSSLASRVHYGETQVSERHWHWYEVNTAFKT